MSIYDDEYKESTDDCKPFFMVVRNFDNKVKAITQSKDIRTAKWKIATYYSISEDSLSAYELSEYGDWKEKKF